MNLYEVIEIICNDYCKYPDIESGNKLADICDKCPMNNCEDLRWADLKTENYRAKMKGEQVMKRKYIRKCGYCGKRFEQKDMVRTDLVRNGWLCKECYESEEPPFDVDEVELGTELF